jgi:hypothetical protein
MQSARRSRKIEKKFFTIESANKMLPLVRSIADDIVARIRDLSEQHDRLEFFQQSRREGLSEAHREEVEQMEQAFEKGKEELSALVEELRSLGVDIKGPDGLVDFPAMLDNREVCLCWKVGEPRVMFWHERDAGFAGRKHLTDGLVFQADNNSGEPLEPCPPQHTTPELDSEK